MTPTEAPVCKLQKPINLKAPLSLCQYFAFSSLRHSWQIKIIYLRHTPQQFAICVLCETSTMLQLINISVTLHRYAFSQGEHWGAQQASTTQPVVENYCYCHTPNPRTYSAARLWPEMMTSACFLVIPEQQQVLPSYLGRWCVIFGQGWLRTNVTHTWSTPLSVFHINDVLSGFFLASVITEGHRANWLDF